MGAFSAAAGCATGLAAPSITSAYSLSATKMTVAWSTVSGATGYQLYRASTAAGPYSKLIGTYTGTSATDNACPASTYSYYEVRAVLTGISQTVYSAMSKCRVTYPIAVPSMSLTRLSATSVKIQWGGVTGATGYEIYYCATANGTYQLVVTASGTVRYYTHKNLTGTKAYYKMRSIRVSGSQKYYSNLCAIGTVQLK
jgi:hypothetical protein